MSTVTARTAMDGRIRRGHPHAAALHLLREGIAEADRAASRAAHSPSLATAARQHAMTLRQSYAVLHATGEPYARAVPTEDQA